MYSWLSKENAAKMKEYESLTDGGFVKASLLEYRMEDTLENSITLVAFCSFFEDGHFVLDTPGVDPKLVLLRRCVAEVGVRRGMLEYIRGYDEVRMTPKGKQWFDDALKWRAQQMKLMETLIQKPLAPHGGSNH